jgi:hypothetical protein
MMPAAVVLLFGELRLMDMLTVPESADVVSRSQRTEGSEQRD